MLVRQRFLLLSLSIRLAAGCEPSTWLIAWKMKMFKLGSHEEAIQGTDSRYGYMKIHIAKAIGYMNFFTSSISPLIYLYRSGFRKEVYTKVLKLINETKN